MFKIHNLFSTAVSTFHKACEESPAAVAVTAVCAAAAIGAARFIFITNLSQIQI